MRRLSLLPLLLLAFAVGCGGSSPRVDGSSEAAFKESVADIQSTLSDEKKQEFQQAIMAIMFEGLGSNLAEMAANANSSGEKVRQKLDGKSVDEIIAMAKSSKEKQTAKQREQMQVEIKELLDKKANAVKFAKDLEAFKVEKSRFYYDKSGFTTQPIIELSVKNGMPQAVAKAYFTAVLATPGRSVPWVEEDFNYEIPGGLEPGESATWSLAPNKFPGLVEAVRRLEGQVVEFDDLVDRVEAERLAAATGGNADQYAELAADAKAKAAALRQELRIRKLAMGAAGQLYMAGELETILPLEELMAYEAANPQQPDGSFRLDDSAQEARHDAIVRQALSHGNEAVIVLGAAHDLSGAIKRAAADCEYARITVVKVKRLMQEESGPD